MKNILQVRNIRLLLLKVAAAMLLMMYTCQATRHIHPLILVPGSGGNQLEARLTRDYKATSLLCNKFYPIVKDKEGWFRIWFDPSVLLGQTFTKCFASRMMLYYDEVLDDYVNAPGVETRVPHFGSTQSLLYLDPLLKDATEYMATLVHSLEQIGYIRDETLFGAPYDFRYGLAGKGHPSRVGSKYLNDLKQLIEKTSASNGGKKVIILSHSLGGLFVLQLLNGNPISWRNKYIEHFISLSAPWGGTVEEMRTFGSGNTLGVPLVDPLLVRGEQRSSQSNLWLLPNPQLFGQTPLVVTPYATYSASDIPRFLKDIGFVEGVRPYKYRTLPLILNQLNAPEVPITCIIGQGVGTPETLFYRNNKNGFDEEPDIVYGDGDGTVNTISLLALESLWAGERNQSLKVIKLNRVSHTSILKDTTALDTITEEISQINLCITNIDNAVNVF